MSGEVICVALIDVDDKGITGGVDLDGVFNMSGGFRRDVANGGAGACLRGGSGGVLTSVFTLCFEYPSVGFSRERNGLCVIFGEWT